LEVLDSRFLHQKGAVSDAQWISMNRAKHLDLRAERIDSAASEVKKELDERAKEHDRRTKELDERAKEHERRTKELEQRTMDLDQRAWRIDDDARKVKKELDDRFKLVFALKASTKRHLLTQTPIYRVGTALSTAITSVEQNVFVNERPEKQDKDKIGVVCVVAPSRHGKSLLLDSIFSNTKEVCVLSVSFNNNIQGPFTMPEDASDAAPCWLLLATVFLRVFGVTQTLGDVAAHLPTVFGKPSMGWEFVARHFSIFAPECKKFVLAIDELSNLMEHLNEGQLVDFNKFLLQIMQPQETLEIRWGIVATGFTTTTPKALISSGVLKSSIAIGSVPADESRPLLVAILMHYGRRETAFPTHLWEVCKSAPGLLGELYVQATGKNFHSSFWVFAKTLYWIIKVVSPEPFANGSGESHLQRNQSLIFRYLDLAFNPSHLTVPQELVDDLINGQLAVQVRDQLVELVPFAFMALMSTDFSLSSDIVQRIPEHWVTVHALLREAVQAGVDRVRNCHPGDDQPTASGLPVEKFVEAALRVRALYHQVYKDHTPKVSLNDWFPACWHSADLKTPPPAEIYFAATLSPIPQMSLGFCFGQAALRQLLSPVLFSIFPIGCEDELDFVKTALAKNPECSDLAAVKAYKGEKKPLPQQHGELKVPMSIFSPSPSAIPFSMNPVPGHPGFTITSFPIGVKEAELKSLVAWLKDKCNEGQTLIIRPTNPSNEVCDLVLLTYWPTDEVEIILLELKDRRHIRLDEVQQKINSAMFFTKPNVWSAFECTAVRVRLVLAGRCESIYTIVENQTKEACMNKPDKKVNENQS